MLKVFAGNVYFGGYLNETWYAFIVYMFWQRPEVLRSVGDNALISVFGKGPMGAYTEKNGLQSLQLYSLCYTLWQTFVR